MYEIIYERSDNMAYLVLMLIVSVAVALFAVQNAMMVDVSFMTWKFSTSLVVVIICSLLAGIIISLFWLLKMKTQNYLQFKKMREQITELENKNSKLAEENKILMYTQKQRMEAQEHEKATIKEANASEKDNKQPVV